MLTRDADEDHVVAEHELCLYSFTPKGLSVAGFDQHVVGV